MRIKPLTIFLASCLALIGCTKETDFLKKDFRRIQMSVSGDGYTKAALIDDPVITFSTPIRNEEIEYTLEITISDGCVTEETKGAPVTTSNIATQYGAFKTTVYYGSVVYDGTALEELSQSMSDLTVTYNSGTRKWLLPNTYYWPFDDQLTFCSYAPLSVGGNNISWNPQQKKAVLNYAMPSPNGSSDAEQQKDVLLAVNTMNCGEDGIADIHFSHALTAVKFIKGDDISDCNIESISLVNFYDKGSGTADFSGAKASWVWSKASDASLKTYVQSFGNIGVDGLAEGASFDSSADERRTFMVIPQKLDATASIVVKMAGIESPIVLNIGSITDAEAGGATNAARIKDWSMYAGKVITFKVNRKKVQPLDIMLVMDTSRSMGWSSQKLVYSPETTSFSYSNTGSLKYNYYMNGKYYPVQHREDNDGSILKTFRCWLFFDVGKTRYYLKGSGEPIQATSDRTPGYDYTPQSIDGTSIQYVEREGTTIYTGTLYSRSYEEESMSRIDVEKSMATELLSLIKENATSCNVSHRVCVARYNDEDFPDGDKDYVNPSNGNFLKEDTGTGSQSSIRKNLVDVVSSYQTVSSIINAETDRNYGTCTYYGMQMAYWEMKEKARQSSDIHKVVILFTDGGTYLKVDKTGDDEDFYSSDANCAVDAVAHSKEYCQNSAKQTKSLGVEIYVVVLPNKNEDTPKMWAWANALSSNSPNASSFEDGKGAPDLGYVIDATVSDRSNLMNALYKRIISH